MTDFSSVTAVLADIGGGTTDVAVFKEGSIWHTSILPVAGYQLTRDVAIGLGLPFEIAEEMKKKYGSVMPVYEGQSDTSPAISKDGHGVSYQDLCDIIRARVEEIMKLIMLELPNSDYETMIPAGLVLTGGSSNLHSLLETLGQRGVQQVLVEGGPTVLASFLKEGLADEVCVYLAPRIMASEGEAYLAAPMTELATAVGLHHVEIKTFGEDIRICGRLGGDEPRSKKASLPPK